VTRAGNKYLNNTIPNELPLLIRTKDINTRFERKSENRLTEDSYRVPSTISDQNEAIFEMPEYLNSTTAVYKAIDVIISVRSYKPNYSEEKQKSVRIS
jgi:hypothetical protein